MLGGSVLSEESRAAVGCTAMPCSRKLGRWRVYMCGEGVDGG